jgi:cytochrome b subunit of formate dehydrogenase
MRYQKAIMMIVTIAMAMLTLTGTALTDQFPQAASAESVGFDALAHDLFGAATLACADDDLAEAQ